MFIEWLKTEMQHEIISICTTENIDSKILVILDKWNHISSQNKSVLFVTFKPLYVKKSFAKCMQVPDGKNKLTVREFFKSLNIEHVVEYHDWNMGSNFSLLLHGILKKVISSFYSTFSMLWVRRRNERAISCPDWILQLWWTWGCGHIAVLMAKESCQIKN
jgi:hypothetical protein